MRIASIVFALICTVFMMTRGAEAAVNIRIDLSAQRMHVTNGKGESYSWAVSTARRGYVTPRGSFRPYSLQRMHYSRKYDNSPMPHSIFFRGGYAIHGTHAVRSLGRPASHGCVRLAPGNAARLFQMVKAEGAYITITGAAPQGAYVAKAKTKHGKHYAAKHGGKKHFAKTKAHRHYAAKKKTSHPLAYAPAQPKAPSLGSWFFNPAGR